MGSLASTAAHAVKAQGVQTGTRRAGACTRQGHWVRGLEASSAPVEAVEDAEQLGDPRRKRTSDQPSKLGGLPPGKSQNYGHDQRSAISASYSVRTVCRSRSCHARAHCLARSQGLAMPPKNRYARAMGAQGRADHRSTAPTTVV